ncbi:MAG: hypothetical protein R3E08_05490 [Thiotrichaceae bacterium]
MTRRTRSSRFQPSLSREKSLKVMVLCHEESGDFKIRDCDGEAFDKSVSCAKMDKAPNYPCEVMIIFGLQPILWQKCSDFL